MPKLLFYNILNAKNYYLTPFPLELPGCVSRHINGAGLCTGRRIASSGRIVRKIGTGRLWQKEVVAILK